MKLKINVFMLFTIVLMFSFTSCQVNWFDRHYCVPWWIIAIPVGFISLITHIYIISRKYHCPECKNVFYPKWYEFSAWLHMGNKRLVKCRKCGYKGFCDIEKH